MPFAALSPSPCLHICNFPSIANRFTLTLKKPGISSMAYSTRRKNCTVHFHPAVYATGGYVTLRREGYCKCQCKWGSSCRAVFTCAVAHSTPDARMWVTRPRAFVFPELRTTA